jgi:hypothetical protein
MIVMLASARCSLCLQTFVCCVCTLRVFEN